MDSQAGVLQSLEWALKVSGINGITPTPSYLGPSLAGSLKQAGVPESEIPMVLWNYRRRFCEVGIHKLHAFVEVIELVRRLRDRGVVQAIATNRLNDIVGRIVTHLGIQDLFQSVQGRMTQQDAKADAVKLSLRRLKLSHMAAITMIGDRAEDYHVATTLGYRFIAVGWGYAEQGELEATNTQIVHSASQLASII